MQPEHQADVLESTSLDLHDTILTQQLSEPQPCRVLVVDDDDLVRARLAALLKEPQFEVDTAASGAEALRAMTEKHFQVLVTDWQMPEMDGISLCRTVRSSRGRGYVYILMITVRDSKRDLLTALAAGADDFLGKGAPAEEILARLAVARRITHVQCSLRTSNRENRRLSMTDALTGANNRRYFMKNLPLELRRAGIHGHWLAVLSCDIDRFKQINDGYGHEVGDQLLQSFVANSNACIRRPGDWLARVGGDEFFFVLPETDMRGANSLAQKLRRALERGPVPTHAGPLNVTVSIGVTAMQAAPEIKNAAAIERLLSGADRGLYISKRLGGNRATCMTLDSARAKRA